MQILVPIGWITDKPDRFHAPRKSAKSATPNEENQKPQKSYISY